jgi:lysosomal acid lipase/cholesteryl ester hydrolase
MLAIVLLALALPALALGGQDPEISMAPDELIQYWGYPAEKYEVTTEDGYILPLYRIPHGKNEQPSSDPKPVIYLQHGLENSAADWLINLPNESAGFIFADAGFDVFVGNFRGTTYSLSHTTLSPKDDAFWQFSWDEMAAYDLPALIGKALQVSGTEKIYYVAHSMGTMTAFAQFSTNQPLADKIKHFYALGPVLNMRNVKGPVRWGAPLTKSMSWVAQVLGIDEFLPNTKLQQYLAAIICPHSHTEVVCMNVLDMISGPTDQMNATRMPVIDAHSPAGTSVQNVVHFGQLINSGNFQAYDYGSTKKNQAKYGTSQPPIYDVTKMSTPISIYYGDNDWLASPKDVEYAVTQFQNVVESFLLKDFNHMDFAWGLRAGDQVFRPIAESIKKDFEA